MRLQSIRFKLLILVGTAFLLSSLLVILMSDRELREITDISQDLIYTEKINEILNLLGSNRQRLQETLMVDAYEDDFKESVINDLRRAHYGNPAQMVYPMIFDGAGKVVLHPKEARGSEALITTPMVQKALTHLSGDFIENSHPSRPSWVITGRFEPWDWTIVYAVPFDIKYTSVKRFRQMLTLIMSVMTFGVILIIYLFLHRITRPMIQLASVSMEMARGNLDQKIEAVTRDEVGVLAKNFITMRDAIRDKITELEEEINKRREAQAATLESETKYRLLFENASDAIFVVQDQAVTFPNPRTLNLFGYTKEELNHMPLADLIHPEDRDRVIEAHQRRIAGDHRVPSTYIARFVKKNGDTLLIEISAVAITWEGRSASLGFLRDITRQKKLEEQLQHAQKMEAIGVLAGGIAHDFNNILSGVLGYTERVSERIRKGDTDVLEDLDSVYQAGSRAKEVVKQILQFSRQADAAFQPLSLAPIVSEVVKLLDVSLPPSIQIRQEPCNLSATVMADAGQIQQVLMNLCTNAVFSLSEKGGRLTIAIEEQIIEASRTIPGGQLPAGRYIVLAVMDNGPGIEAKLLDRIFEPYYTTKPKDQGTGLGLAVSNGIVQNHGGVLTVSSCPGVETRFNVYLPAAQVPAKAPVAVHTPIEGGGERILLVDDEAFFLNLSTKVLMELGYDVTPVDDSRAALEIVTHSEKLFDILVTDQTMPKMTGLDLIQHIRDLDLDIPVIICTGFSENINTRTAEQIGVADILFKPVTKRDLAGAIRRVLDKSSDQAVKHGQPSHY